MSGLDIIGPQLAVLLTAGVVVIIDAAIPHQRRVIPYVCLVGLVLSALWTTSWVARDDYQDAYEEAIRRTAATHAPWIVVPANRKWYRDLVICQTLIDTLERLDLRYPEPVDDLSGIVVE